MDGQIESTLRNCTFRPVFPVVFPFHQGQCRHIAVEAWILDDEVVDWGEEPAKRYHFSFFIRDWMMIHDELGWAISWLYHAELCDESWEKKWMSSFFTHHPESLPSMGPQSATFNGCEWWFVSSAVSFLTLRNITTCTYMYRNMYSAGKYLRFL